MIKTILVALSIAFMVPATVAVCALTKSPRPEVASSALHDVWLTQSQAQRLLDSVDTIIQYVQELNAYNKAPRPGAGPCDPDFPGCQLVDLSAIADCLCSIKLQLCCICERQLSASEGLASCCEVIGDCDDLSFVLPSQVVKSDIDALCLSVVSLLKTVLLELRGVFTVIP